MRYRAVLIDPPVPFRVWGNPNANMRSAESHYPTMTWDELNALGPLIREVMEPDSALFLWLCQPLLVETLNMAINHWKCDYKTKAFGWVKTDRKKPSFFKGMGYWTRANTEDVLLFTRGSPKRKSKNISQAIHRIMGLLGLLDGVPRMRKRVPTLTTPISKHSEKPSQIHTAITQLVEGPYLELFARKPVKGWTCLGNEIDGLDIREAIQRQIDAPTPE